MGKRPSIGMVASLAGVSVATVSNVLNRKASVSPEIAERVRAAVDALGYVRDQRAARLRSGESRLVGVIVPDLTNPMFAAFLSTLEQRARLDGYDLVVVSAHNQPGEEAQRLRHLRGWRPAGLIVIPCDGALEERLPPGLAVPIVVADRIPDAPGFDLVAVDNAAAAATLVRRLARQGCRDCLVAGTSLRISNVRERWEGALGAAGGMRLDLVEVGFEDHAPPALEARLREEVPDAVFCLDHETTLAVYQLAARLGIAVGEDLAFASFDEMEWMRLVTPPVSAARQPVEEMAERAWRLLVGRIGGDEAPPERLRLTCAVTFRGSTSLWTPGRTLRPRRPITSIGG
ncbi:LacI family DNA-binding transcriptional regulator [Amaricoccus sp.]|uniref:LacI family DNA-binding transcriptional regulator n=1 Tax=Amaricoccus sp. TaxID=1872485 RepID=UPI001B704C53|nr:LacI family DNA-binding transcriptional regulator [Amaricoccus sp.]MBP7001618.1 LacI family DNA-binding transcriptional regulator [Amaricoccus sp.]